MAVLVTDVSTGVVLLLCALVTLGTWPAMLDFCSLYKRNSIHTFMDYLLGDLVCATLLALTLGNMGLHTAENPSFIEQLLHVPSNWPCVLAALAGGCLLMYGNWTLQMSLSMGTSLGVVLPVQAALTVSIGTIINYALQPEHSKLEFLIPGLFAFVAAIGISSAAEFAYKAHLRKLSMAHPKGLAHRHVEGKDLASAPHSDAASNDSEPSCGDEANVVAESLTEERAIQNANRVGAGIAVAASGGLAFGFFSPFFNVAVNDQFGWLPEGEARLTGWTANFWFAVAVFLSGMVVCAVRAKMSDEPTTVHKYLADHNRHYLAFATGIVCAAGNTLQFLGGIAAGFAAADMVQAFPLVGIVWGLIFFGEFRKGSQLVKGLLVAVYLVYIVAVGLLIASVNPDA